MTRQTDVRGKGSIKKGVRDLLIAKYGSAQKVNVSEVARDTGLNMATVKSWLDGTVRRFDEECLITWCAYFNVANILMIINYVPPAKRSKADSTV